MGHPGGCERISQGRWIPECLHAGESKTPAELVLWAGQEAPACRTPGRTHPGTWRETGCTSGLAGTLHLSGVRGHLADGVGVSFTEDTFWMPKTETGLGMWGLPGTRHPFQGQRGGSPEGERREKGVRPSCRSAALRLPGEPAPGGSRQAGALLPLRMAWTPRSDCPAPSAPDSPLSPGEAFLLPRPRVAEAANLRHDPGFQPRVLQGPGSPGPIWERSRLRASSSRRRSLMVAAGGRRPGEGGSGEAALQRLQRRQGHRLYRAGGLHNHTHRREGRRPTARERF